jgi:uncharacterized cupin superfamily protein
MKKIDRLAAPIREGAFYPPPHDAPCKARVRWRLGRAADLTQFGVNYLLLKPGVWSSQRHWHTKNDEFVYVLEGEVVLVTGAGEEVLKPGDSAGFKAGDTDGHHLINRSDADAVVLEIGSSFADDEGEYSDIDMKFNATRYFHKDGTPY